MAKHIRRRMFVFGVLWACIPLGWLVSIPFADGEVNAELRTLQANGYAIRWVDLAPVVSEAENAAEFYREAFRRIERVGAEPGPGPTDLRVVDSEGTRKSEWDDCAAASDACCHGVAALSEEQRAAFLRWCRAHDDAVPFLIRASQRPSCRYTADFAQGDDISLDYVGSARKASWYLCARAVLASSEGNAEGSRDFVRLAIRLADSLAGDPCEFSQLVRLCILGDALHVARPPLPIRRTEEEIRAWLALIPDPAALDHLADFGLRGDLAIEAGLAVAPAIRTWHHTVFS